MREDARDEAFRRNPALEDLLASLNAAIAPGGDALAAERGAPTRPVVLVVGCPRSGTTLLMQWLAASGAFGYPSNLLSRFWRAPAVGAMVERLLFDPAVQFRDELGLGSAPAVGFDSDLGKTAGARSPNEFWYFWRRFFPLGEAGGLGEAGRAGVDGPGFLGELAAWEAAVGRPLALKAVLLAWDLPLLAALLPRAVFVDIRRDPFYNAQALLLARRRFFGDARRWYSVRPPEAGALADRTPHEQVVGQVGYMRRAIDGGLASLDPRRVVRLAYARFCGDPAEAWAELVRALRAAGEEIDPSYRGPARFEASDGVRVTSEEAEAIAAAWEEFPFAGIGGDPSSTAGRGDR